MAKKVKKQIASKWPPTAPSMDTNVASVASPHPMVPMSPSMVTAIKSSKKGKIPPGLAKYLAQKRAMKQVIQHG